MKKQTLARWALIEVAVFWGLSWFGYRGLHQMGMSGMSAGVASSIAAAVFAFILGYQSLRTGSWRAVPLSLLFLMMAGSAISSLGFTWGVVHGEVMRVMLLFYLMPVWSSIMAHFILKERTNWAGWLGVSVGLIGAALMLYDPELGSPFPKSSAEWAGLVAGLGSAVLNISVRKTPQMAQDSRAFFLSLGGVILGLAWLPFEEGPHLPRVEVFGWAVLLVLLMGGLLLFTNRMYQFGMRYLSTHQAVVIFPFELVVGAVSSWLLANEVMTLRAWLGGLLIIGAGLISSWWGEAAH
jgi:drug/metabolite transporter (DMT)-like permease